MSTKKQAIKDLLEMGVTIKFPFKSQIDSWYSDVSIHKSDFLGDINNPIYYISPYMKYSHDVDEIVNKFCEEAFTSKNIGLVQMNLMKKHPSFEEDFDLEKPTKELREMFIEEGKLVDEEYKKNF